MRFQNNPRGGGENTKPRVNDGHVKRASGTLLVIPEISLLGLS